MSFLPEIVDGQIQEDATPKLFTPKQKVRPLSFETDGAKRDKTHYKDAPTMANIHECEMDIYDKCFICHRPMTV